LAEEGDSLSDDIERGIAALFTHFGEEGSRLLKRCAPKGNEQACFEFPLAPDYLGVQRTLRISFDKSFPASGLAFQIQPSAWLKWPHVMKDTLCLYGAGNAPVFGSPEQVVADKFARLTALLQLVLPLEAEAKRRAEFNQEITSYWNQQINQAYHTWQQLILLDLPGAAVPLCAMSDQRWRLGNVDERVWLADDAKRLFKHISKVSGSSKKVKAPATAGFFAPLISIPGVELPHAKNLISWLEPHLNAEDAKALTEWESDSANYPARWLLLRLPDTEPPLVKAFVLRSTAMKKNGHFHYGRRAERRYHRSDTTRGAVVLQAANLQLLTPATLHSRDTGTDQSQLGKKRVVLIGAGTLGAAVATHLARAGITKMTVIDPDELEDANIGRHVLGADDLGRRKVYALKERLELDLPFVEIQPVAQYLHLALLDKPTLLDEADLVIVTTADWWSEERLWNLKSKGTNWSLVHGWSEPHAVVGHVLVANAEQVADARHLFNPYGKFTHRFTDWPQNGFIPLPGCGASFIPGGPVSIAAISTMISDTAIAALTQDIPDPLWLTHVSNPEKIARAGGIYLGQPLPEHCESIIMKRLWPEGTPE
jgi:hypothetical protein